MSLSEKFKQLYFRWQMYPTFQALRTEFSQQLSAQYDEREIAQLFFESTSWISGWSKVDLALNLKFHASEDEYIRFQNILGKLKEGIPFQQITGRAWFFDRWFNVDENVLIPRPETEELVRWILQSHLEIELDVLDIGTGSGIIPISLLNKRPTWNLTGLDVSEKALKIAMDNGIHSPHTNLNWILDDILSPTKKYDKFQIIISNPPYVLNSDQKQMNARVLNYEPHLALFVDDKDPLLFYRKIIEFSEIYLVQGGFLYFEIHENFAQEMQSLMQQAGYQSVEFKTDFQEKPRMIRGIKP